MVDIMSEPRKRELICRKYELKILRVDRFLSTFFLWHNEPMDPIIRNLKYLDLATSAQAEVSILEKRPSHVVI